MKPKRDNKLLQIVQAWRLDRVIDAPVKQPPVVQVVHTIADEARVDVAFVEDLATRLEKRYAVTIPDFSSQNKNSISERKNRESGNKQRRLVMRLSWGMTVVCTVLITLALVLLARPTALPPEKILADAVEATTRRPGMVEHIVVETHLELSLTGETTQDFYIIEEWRQLGGVSMDAVVTTARSTVRYAIADVQRQMPVAWAYESADQVCSLSRNVRPREHSIADTMFLIREPGSDAVGCVRRSQSSSLFMPELTAPNLETGLQLWLNRLQDVVDTLDYEKTTFFAKEAFSFTETDGTVRFTLYVDPDTAYPLGFVAQTPTYALTQIVHSYEVIAADSLGVFPFVWPPVALGEGVEIITP